MPSGSVRGSAAQHKPQVAGTADGSSDRPRPPRKLNRSANQLHRNQACLPCRRRRIKCDAARPHCSSCVRSFRFLARTQPDPERDARGVQCHYEDSVDSGELSDGDGRGQVDDDPRAAVSKLEARIADLQNTLARLTSPASSSASQPQLYPHDSMSWMVDPMNHHHHPSFSGDSSPFTAMHPNPSPNASHSGTATGTAPANAQLPLMTPHHMGETQHHDPHLVPNNSLPAAAATAAAEGITGFVEMSMSGIGPLPNRGALGSMVPPSSGAMPHSHPARPSSASATQQRVSGGLDTMDHDASSGGQLNELLWPGWPSRLPTLEVLDHLVQTFFTMVPSVSRILNRESLIARLGLPPQHANFPHLALLHAICAITARYTAAVHTVPVDEMISNTNDELAGKRRVPANMTGEDVAASQRCFGERHSLFAQLEMRWSDLAGRRMLDVAQAAVIMAVYLQQHAKWIEGWMMVGSAVRLTVPMGLLNDTSGDIRAPNSIVEAPENDVEREERRLVVAYLMTLDFAFSAPSGWPVTLSHDELWSRLPASKTQFEQGGTIPQNDQAWWDDKLYAKHQVVDSFVLYAKASHLFGSILKFTRKLQTVNDVGAMRASAMFINCEKEAAAFKANMPPAFQDPFRTLNGQKGIDADLINAHVLPSIMLIKLHEPFVDLGDMRNESTQCVVREARAVLDIVCSLTSTALDLSYALSPISSYYFFIAARTLVQMYKTALQTGDMAAAKIHLSEIDVFRLVFSSMAHRFALSARHCTMIDHQLSSANADAGIAMSAVRDGVDPLMERRREMSDYGEQPLPWLFGHERSGDTSSGDMSPIKPTTPAETANINKPSSSLFLTPNEFRSSHMDHAMEHAMDEQGVARFSPHSSPQDQASTPVHLNMLHEQPPLMSHHHFHTQQHFPPLPPHQYPVDNMYTPEAPYSVFGDTQAAWLHSVNAATIPRTFMGYGGGDAGSG